MLLWNLRLAPRCRQQQADYHVSNAWHLRDLNEQAAQQAVYLSTNISTFEGRPGMGMPDGNLGASGAADLTDSTAFCASACAIAESVKFETETRARCSHSSSFAAEACGDCDTQLPAMVLFSRLHLRTASSDLTRNLSIGSCTDTHLRGQARDRDAGRQLGRLWRGSLDGLRRLLCLLGQPGDRDALRQRLGSRRRHLFHRLLRLLLQPLQLLWRLQGNTTARQAEVSNTCSAQSSLLAFTPAALHICSVAEGQHGRQKHVTPSSDHVVLQPADGAHVHVPRPGV